MGSIDLLGHQGKFDEIGFVFYRIEFDDIQSIVEMTVNGEGIR